MKKTIRKMTAVLLTLAICGGSCIGINANAQEIDEEAPSLKKESSFEPSEDFNFPQYPVNGQKYWVIFKEGFRNERIEMTTCDIQTESDNCYIKWDTNLTLQGASTSKQYNQYYLNKNSEWEQIGTYELFSDYATSVIASNLDIYDPSGKLILNKTNYNNEDISAKIKNPIIEADASMEAGQKVTWDCVWFGSYPQAEIISSEENYNALSKDILKDGDIIADRNLYNTLQDATEWDENNEITINKSKYRRIKQSDATCAYSLDGYYSWSDSDTWHYFKYKPIKWQVLSTDGNQAFLLSNITLDAQQYHTKFEIVTWKMSTLRSWLNGYDSNSNQQNTNYTNNNFITSAFSVNEITKIENLQDTTMENISDKVFLLSQEDVFQNKAKLYGFTTNGDIYDEARMCKSSTYAKAMGVDTDTYSTYKGNCSWLLRVSEKTGNSGNVWSYGVIDGSSTVQSCSGIRPALNLNLSSDQWSYAGTVCSDGTIDEEDNTDNIENNDFFVIGRHSNKWAHNDDDFGYNEKKTHCLQYTSDSIGTVYPTSLKYYSKLLKDLDFNDEISLLDAMHNGEWGGSCQGLSISMALANIEKIDVASIGSDHAPYYFKLSAPANNLELRNLINYYQLMQYVNKMPKMTILWNDVRSRFKNLILSSDTIIWNTKDFWKGFLADVKAATEEKIPLLFGFGYGKDGGHAILTCGYDENTNKDYYIVKLYNCNCRTDYLYLFITKDYKTFSLSTSKDKLIPCTDYVTEDDWRFFSYCNKDAMNEIGNETSYDMARTVTTTPKNTATFQVGIDDQFSLTNSAGKHLKFDGTEYSGDMEIYDMQIIGNEEQYFKFTIPADDIFILTDIENDNKYSASIGGNYYTVKASGADSIRLVKDTGIQISGKNHSFSTSLSLKNKNALINISGNCTDDANIYYCDNTIGLTTPGKYSSVNTKTITTQGIENKTINGTFSNKNIDSQEEIKNQGNSSNKKKVSKITLSGISKKIAAEKKVKLTAKISPSNATNKALTWKSSNSKIATVNSKGVVTMKKNSGGKKVTITAIANDGSRVKGTYKITSMKGVVKKVAISGKKSVKAGKSLKLKARVNASKGANTKLKWTSSNTKYAKVNSKGAVKAYKKGKGKTVKITALATDGSNKKSSIKIKIK